MMEERICKDCRSFSRPHMWCSKKVVTALTTILIPNSLDDLGSNPWLLEFESIRNNEFGFK